MEIILHKIKPENRSYCKSNLLYRRTRRIKKINLKLKIITCKIFGHRINENPNSKWCERCGLGFDEIYHPVTECINNSCDCHTIQEVK